MAGEDRIAKLESNVEHLLSELHSFRTEVAKEFGAFRTEVATRFGSVDTRLESLKRWVVVSGLSTLATLLGVLATVGHTLKWF